MSIPFLRSFNRQLDRYVGLLNLSPALEAQVRAEQIASILQMTPAMMTGNVIIAIIVISQYLDHPKLPFLIVWAGFVLVMVIAALLAWNRTRISPPRRQASSRGIRRAVVNAALLGILWGALPLMTIIYDPEGPRRLMIVVTIAGIICGGGFALSAVPKAVIAFTLPIFIGSAITLLNTFTITDQFVAMLLVTYWVIVVAASLSSARVFIGRLVAMAESDERGAVIAMLLKEFEDHASDWLWSTDADNRLKHVSERFAAVSRTALDDLTGLPLFDLLKGTGRQMHPGFALICDHVKNRTAFGDIELPVDLEDQRFWWKLSAQPAFDAEGEFLGYRGVGSDVTDQKNAEARVAYLAHYDDLTNLSNRANFTDHLNEAIQQLERFDIGFAILLIDLDQFKAVNDTRGHEVGDQLLVKIGRRFATTIGKDDFVARLGGDEFAVIQTNPPDRETTTNLADRMIEAARKPITVAGLPVSVGASIGIAIAPTHGTRSDQIMRSADLALYRAKQSGRNTFRIYEVEMDRVAQERRVLERQVSRALEQDQFELHFQPLVEVDTDRVTGFEALVRWNHPDRGSVSPEIFIPVAEQTGAIRAIGDWVLKQACNTAAHWPDDLTLAVNLSVRQFENGRIIRSVTEALEASSLPAGKLEIEVTESVLIEHPEETIEILNELKALGVSIAIDDFGTGYSSLSYLWKFPFDKIKLDQSFVAAIEHDKVACDILRIIGSLGQTLGMRITAEGVETIEQADFLRTIACHQLQGFYFSKPLAPDELPAFLAENLTGRIRQESGPPKKSGRKAAGDK